MGKSIEKRGAGILMAISSLPSRYGIGTLGKEAYLFVDWLMSAGQSYWQVLPVGPTGFGDSPYQSFSAFAGNPYFIDLESLVEEDLLTTAELEEIEWGQHENQVDYGKLFSNRILILQRAYGRKDWKQEESYVSFCKCHRSWLEDYALFMSLKYHFQQKCWLEWDEDIRFRKRKALDFYRKELMGDLEFWKVCQFLFYKQWHELKVYANKRGVQLIGDIPLYVSLDSVDVWANASLFLLGSDRRPTCVAGVPPDCFSEEGQLWGNPIYNWRKMHLSNFSWWRKRMQANAELYDVIRVDHFIGIVRYYSIPAGEANAKKGKWCKGPGKRLTREIEAAIGEASIIAEDLGVITEEVRALMHEMNWPGMKVLEFAFSGEPQNEYLPHNYKSPNCVLYGGTHDNDTLLGFIKSVTPEQRAQLLNYINVDEEDSLLHSIIKVGYASIARTAIFQMQDILALGTEARMNEPSTVGTNWVWRMSCNQLKEKDAKWLSDQVDTYGRH